MANGKYILLLTLVFLGSEISFAQNSSAPGDSAKVYRQIENFAKKKKSTNFIYRILFKPANISPAQKIKSSKRKNIPQRYSVFEGKIIRDIHITTLQPFGYSVTDTLVRTKNFLNNVGNGTHIK